jgi:hypothetical protein
MAKSSACFIARAREELRLAEHARLPREPQVMQVGDAVEHVGARAPLPRQARVGGGVTQAVQIDELISPRIAPQHLLDGGDRGCDVPPDRVEAGHVRRRVSHHLFCGNEFDRIAERDQRADVAEDRVRARIARRIGQAIVHDQRAADFLRLFVGPRQKRKSVTQVAAAGHLPLRPQLPHPIDAALQ